MLRGVLEAQAPPKQNATDTISVLSNRLASATLLEDRRGAILGLRSFAKQYPASVASGSLRALIGVLTQDVEDVETAKSVLETLLMLFNPDANSPEASDDIALWLADEFSVRQDNITVLLSLLEISDFYSRLYALQLLTAIASARPERTQDCILSAPLGTTRLVATLDDAREAVRSAGLLLLTDITQASPELQKLVAFENAFERIFKMLKLEGSFGHGGIVVQDCLALLANLLDLNPSNQSLFRESGFFATLVKLLSEDAHSAAQATNGDSTPNGTRDKNLWGLLAILKMFLVQGNAGTQANQNAFEKQGLMQVIMSMGFDQSLGPPVRAEALATCAEVIRGNSGIQERFAHNKIPSTGTPPVNHDRRRSSEKNKVYIIDALLNMTLNVPTLSLFDVRFAASECIIAYFFNHSKIRHHFIRRAVDVHKAGGDETSIFSILIEGPRSTSTPDPYRIWFAARIAFELLYEDETAKEMTMAIKEGDAESGEEVVTCLQALTGNLMSAIQTGEDNRTAVAYLMLLSGWLFDDPDAVNDVLQEGSSVQSLIQAAAKTGKGTELITGLCTVLLGILYEFSTKESPVSRRQLQPLITSGLGRDTYISRIKRLRQLPVVRDFEVMPQKLSSVAAGELPEVYFDQGFVNLLKDNFNRLIRAIDRNPVLEVARMQEGIDRDVVDSLRAQIEDKSQALQKAQAELHDKDHLLNQEQSDHRRTQETVKDEVARIKRINDSLQRNHEADAAKVEGEHRAALQKIDQQHRRQVDELQRQHGSEAAGMQQRLKTSESSLAQTKANLEKMQKAHKDTSDTLRQRDEQIATSKKESQQREALLRDLQTTVQQREAQINEAKATVLDKESQIQKLNDSLKRRDNDIKQLKQSQQQLEDQLGALQKENTQLETYAASQDTKAKELERRLQEAETQAKQANTTEQDSKVTDLEKKLSDAETRAKTAQAQIDELRKAVDTKEEARQSAQSELDDLLIVLTDLEEKRTRDKAKLKELGAETSDGESDDEGEPDGAVGDEDDDEKDDDVD